MNVKKLKKPCEEKDCVYILNAFPWCEKYKEIFARDSFLWAESDGLFKDLGDSSTCGFYEKSKGVIQ